MPSTALILGASRGLGLGLVRHTLSRGWSVIGTVRGTQRTPLHELAEAAGGALTIETADINEPAQMAALDERLGGRKLDLLLVNAGVSNGPAEAVAEVTTDEFTRVMVTNALSPLRAIETLIGRVTPEGTVAVMSSGLGSVANNTTGGWEVYRASKAALNTLMRSLAARHSQERRTFLTIAPGWVRTDMGGPGASLDVDTSISGVVSAIEARRGQGGLHYINYQNETVPW